MSDTPGSLLRYPEPRRVERIEDASRVRKQSGPQVMAAILNAAIGWLRSTGVGHIAEALRRNGSCVNDLIDRLGILKR